MKNDFLKVINAVDECICTPNGWADGFMGAYSVIPEPQEFQFGAMKRLGFTGFITSKVILA